jgi:hypothetical protein
MSFLLIMTLAFIVVVALDFAEKKRQSSAR